MQLKFEQLTNSISKELNNHYLISGDEPWQKEEAEKIICDNAKLKGFHINKTYHIDSDKAWQEFATNTNTIGLFTNKQLYKITLKKNKITNKGLKIISNFWHNSNKDIIIVITSPKLSAAEKKLAWLKKFSDIGVVITVWPIQANQMVAWTKSRLNNHKLKANSDVIHQLISLTQNNLHALEQTIIKIKLSSDVEVISSEYLSKIIFQQSKFSIFDILDPIAFGDSKLVITILESLQHDPAQINTVLFMILNDLVECLDDNYREKNYYNKKKLVRLDKYRNKFTSKEIIKTISQAREIEKAIKGATNNEPWHLLSKLCLKLAAVKNITLSEI
ncbi:MAG: DNA polymerase III subunit delta [Pseudomonadota bacterium]|nr:DNA polymerase III subunit delta [Pseudomonadota bacterium]